MNKKRRQSKTQNFQFLKQHVTISMCSVDCGLTIISFINNGEGN